MSAAPPGWPPAPARIHHYSCTCNELHGARITRDEYGDLSRKGSSRRALSVKSRQAKRAEPCSHARHASHDSNGVALLTWQAAGEWSARACVQTMCHSEPGSYQACGAEGPSACRGLGRAGYTGTRCQRRGGGTSHTCAMPSNGGPLSGVTTLKRHQWGCFVHRPWVARQGGKALKAICVVLCLAALKLSS